MIRATTPTHVFKFDDDPSVWDEILITYKQDAVVIEKNKSDCVIDGNAKTASVTLTQAETNRFCSGAPIKVQVRVAMNSGEAFASSVFSVPVQDVLNDEVLP